jgi:hypothetical protein
VGKRSDTVPAFADQSWATESDWPCPNVALTASLCRHYGLVSRACRRRSVRVDPTVRPSRRANPLAKRLKVPLTNAIVQRAALGSLLGRAF